MKKFVIKVNGNVYEVEVEETENFKNTPISAACGCSEGSARTLLRRLRLLLRLDRMLFLRDAGYNS